MSQSHPGKDVFGKLSWATLALGLALAAISYLAYVASLDLIMTPELAGDVLLGQEILRQKSLVPTAWYYGDTLGTIGVPAFSAFFSLFNAGYLLSYRLGVLLMLGLELISFSYMADRLRLTRTSSLLFLGIFLGARSFVSGTWSGMGFCLLGMYHVMFFLAVGYLSARDQGNFGRPEKALRFLLPALSFLLGLEGLLILLVLLVPLVLLRPVRLPWRPAPARGPRPSFREVALWAALGLLGYLCLSFLVLPRGFGPSLPYTTEITGAYHAVMGNIPSLFVSFLDDTPLWAIKGPADILAPPSLASFAFLTLCAYSLYVARASFRSAGPVLAFPLRLLLVGLVLTFLLTIICVPQARIKSLFYFYILLAFIIVIYHNYLESDNPRLASLLVLACGA
ncbi:MAG: hypothetical protein LBF40_00290, partial [Deltaproteobacteria bacterium]|nr:hypothetical protein [Deltaproteobacteria bacterium]